MTFTTPTFLVFLVVVYLLYWELPQRFQNYVILLASLVFYGWWDWRFLVLMMAVAFVDYLVALGLSVTAMASTRRLLLGVSLLSNLGILGFFKCFTSTSHWAGTGPPWVGRGALGTSQLHSHDFRQRHS